MASVQKENNKRGWIGVFNRSSNEVDVQLEKVLLGLDHDEYSLFDIWNEKEFSLDQNYK